MRPIEKGDAPRSYKNYQDAKTDLIWRLGEYCTYCERRIPASLAVEHVQPKSEVPSLEKLWVNFLLACSNCNACKGKKQISISNYFWPHLDNTLLYIEYKRGGLIRPLPKLKDPELIKKAENIIELVGLNLYPGNPNKNHRPSINDLRWLSRKNCWNKANDYKRKFEKNLVSKENILDLALASGFFSIWWTVFKEYPEIRRLLRKKFKGTASSCFDRNENPIPRPQKPMAKLIRKNP